MIELLHFLLGARADRNHLVNHKELRQTVFTLALDWPGQTTPLDISRQGSSASTVLLEPCPIVGDGLFQDRFCRTPLAEWQALIESNLFGLSSEIPGVSGRAILSFLMRKVGDHGFNEATRSFARQSETQATPNLAYLLGLDASLAARYQELATRKAARSQLKKAVNDPAWGKVVGRSGDLRGEIAIRESRIADLNRQIKNFQVIPQFEILKARADELAALIRELGDKDVLDRRNLDHLMKSVVDAVDPEVRYLERVYEDLEIALPTHISKRFDEVRAFHAAVVANRRTYLEQEIKDARARLAARERERARLGDEQSAILKQLSEGGALAALTTLQKALGQEEAALGALRHRLDAALAVESSGRELESDLLRLSQEVETDLEERQAIVSQATVFFNECVQRLYGTNRHSYLKIEPSRSSLKITPKIDSDLSSGINRMAIFCFDLTVAVIAHRAGRAPDFLVHDSHMFDGVDDRQLTNALELAAETVDAEGMQYIVTINEDELAKAERLGFSSDPHVIEPRLSDAYDEGGLFGFRFDR
ncbi:ABC-three component system protein [Sinosporangium album]|uniref:ABC-three component system protein n=1 Tax=Sinosporangium album TaxID=504805 RepID=UPI001FE0C0DE|nr:ABC-three component system protein [Sinosporangium album]